MRSRRVPRVAILFTKIVVALGINRVHHDHDGQGIIEDLAKEASLMKARSFILPHEDPNAPAVDENLPYLDESPVTRQRPSLRNPQGSLQDILANTAQNILGTNPRPQERSVRTPLEGLSDSELRSKAIFEDEFGLPLDNDSWSGMPMAAGAGKPIATMGHGTSYGNHAASQRMYLKLLQPSIIRELKDGDFVYDLCGADGINTVDLLGAMKEKTENFTFGFLDLPGNDWTTARKSLRQVVSRVVPTQGIANATNAIVNGRCKSDCKFKALGGGPSAILMAGSFFHQVAPLRSVSIAFSNTCVHYLSGNHDLKPNLKAAQDWYQFLVNREKELVHGGTLHVTGLARSFKAPLWSYMQANTVLKESLAEALQLGILTPVQVKGWRFPVYSRTSAEWTLPFDKNMIPTLALESFKIATLPTPYWAMANGNAHRFAELYVPSIKAWIGPYIEGTLGTRFLNHYMTTLYEDIIKNPFSYQNDYVQAVMRIRKY